MSETSSQHTSPSLLARIRTEDAQAWRQLVDLYGPLVSEWCRRKGLSNDDGADVVQNVFMSVARGLAGWQPIAGQDGCFRAWLWTITKNRIIDHIRSRPFDQGVGGSSNLRSLDMTESCDALDDEEPTVELDLTHLVQRAMQQVEASVERRTWQAFWRTVVDGQATESIACELEISTASVRQARSRILHKIREQLGDC
jgi:RNA polymerase sigma-70 factor (ECF subfamily)